MQMQYTFEPKLQPLAERCACYVVPASNTFSQERVPALGGEQLTIQRAESATTSRKPCKTGQSRGWLLEPA